MLDDLLVGALCKLQWRYAYRFLLYGYTRKIQHYFEKITAISKIYENFSINALRNKTHVLFNCIAGASKHKVCRYIILNTKRYESLNHSIKFD